MSVKIYRSHHLDGMPTLEYSIVINGVRIQISEADFKELTNELGSKIASDYAEAKQVYAKWSTNIDKLQELRKDIINIFWDGHSDEDYFFRKTIDEIDQEKLFDVLEKHSKFLGFE